MTIRETMGAVREAEEEAERIIAGAKEGEKGDVARALEERKEHLSAARRDAEKKLDALREEIEAGRRDESGLLVTEAESEKKKLRLSAERHGEEALERLLALFLESASKGGL